MGSLETFLGLETVSRRIFSVLVLVLVLRKMSSSNLTHVQRVISVPQPSNTRKLCYLKETARRSSCLVAVYSSLTHYKFKSTEAPKAIGFRAIDMQAQKSQNRI